MGVSWKGNNKVAENVNHAQWLLQKQSLHENELNTRLPKGINQIIFDLFDQGVIRLILLLLSDMKWNKINSFQLNTSQSS